MQADDDPQGDPPDGTGPGTFVGIADLTEEEREMLREFAGQLRDQDVRNPVAREALDRAAEQLEQVASSFPDKA